jgi:hypothetical protein
MLWPQKAMHGDKKANEGKSSSWWLHWLAPEALVASYYYYTINISTVRQISELWDRPEDRAVAITTCIKLAMLESC